MSDAELVVHTSRYPSDADALLVLARRMEKAGMTDEALSDYRKAADADAKQSAAWAGVARLAVKRRDPILAHDAALRLLNDATADGAALTEAGNAFLTLGDKNSARDALTKAVEKDSQNGAAWDALTQTNLSLMRLAEAVSAGENAIKLSPGEARYWLHLAMARRLSAHPTGAAAAIAEAARLAPDDGEILLEAGTLYAQTGKIPRGKGDEKRGAAALLMSARQKLRGTPLESEALRRLGQFYLTERRFPEAQRILEECLRLAPDDGEAIFALSRAFALQGRVREAQALTEKAARRSAYELEARNLRMRIQREPTRADLLNRLGDLHYANGNPSSARLVWTQSLNIKPDQPNIRRALGRLPENP